MAEYVSVTWTTGDVLTEAKLDNMVANDQSETAHSANGMIMNNNVPYRAKQAGGTTKDVMKLGTDDILRLSQIEVQENTTNSTAEDIMIQTGWGLLDGVTAATITTTVTLATPIDEDETFSIIVGALGLFVGTPTKISQLQTENTRMILQAHVEVSGSNITGFTVKARRNDDSNFSSSADYGFSWTVIGRKA